MKKTVSLLLVLLILSSLFAGLTLHAAAEPEEPAALEVYTQTGEAEAELVKAYTPAELDALKETNAEGCSYVYWKGDDMKTVVATEYVVLDALLADAGTTFGAGDELKFTCSDGPYPKGDFRYEIMAERGYDPKGNAVPSAFALTYGNTLEAQENTGKLRFVCGATAEEIEAKSAAGARMPSDVVAVTIVKAEPELIQPDNPFEDVEEGKYFYDAVLWAVNHEPQITKGTDDTHFAPNNDCTRGQVVTFLWRAHGCEEPASTENPFEDVEEGKFYYDAVLWAVEKNITKGVDETHFGPGNTCTRGQVVTFLWRAAGEPAATTAGDPIIPGENETPIVPLNPDDQEVPECPFIDVDPDAFYYKAMLWAVANEITKGTSDTAFAPGNVCTRGQVVTFLYRADGE